MTALQWQEPPARRRSIYYANERADPMNSVRFAGLAFVMLLGLRWLSGLHPEPDRHPPGWGITALIAFAVALFVAWGIPALLAYLPTQTVILSGKGLNHNALIGRGARIRFWGWDRIAWCSFATETVYGRPVRLLCLHDDAGDELFAVALAARPTEPEIAAFIRACGRELR